MTLTAVVSAEARSNLHALAELARRRNLSVALSRLPVGCTRFVCDHTDALLCAPGSGHNHQAWPGGYLDHLDEVCGAAGALHDAMSALRPLPFTVDDALLVLFLHDVEKVFKRLPDGCRHDPVYARLVADPRALQERVCVDYELSLTAEQRNALRYVHGEGDDYRKDKRVMGPLAAFCHMCDVWSARGWPDEPAVGGPLPLTLTTFPA